MVFEGTTIALPRASEVKQQIVLVTGGSGFIGQHLVRVLRGRGYTVRILDLHPPVDRAGIEFIQGSILDDHEVRRALKGVDTVFHLAGIPHLWIPQEREYDRVNVGGTQLLLSAAAEMSVSRFVHCSTEAVLFPPRGRESAACGLDDMAGPYTRSKFLAEQAACSAAKSGLPVVVVNPTVPIGPGDRSFTPPTAMLWLFLRKPPAFILDFVMNLVDVSDVAKGIVLAAERGRIGERYVLGGENIMVRDVVRRVCALCGRRAHPLPLPGPAALMAGVVAEWFANHVSHRTPVATAEGIRLALRSIPLDTRKAQIDLGYSPSGIGKALAETVAWLSQKDAPPLSPVAEGDDPAFSDACNDARV